MNRMKTISFVLAWMSHRTGHPVHAASAPPPAEGASTRTSAVAFLIASALALGGASVLPAQEVALAALLVEADSANPEIVVARSGAEAASARVPQAGALPDPTVGVGVMNMPLADPGFGQDPMTMTQVQLGARLPWPGKLSLREDVARLRAEAAEWEAERVRQRVRSEVKSHYYRIYFLDRALDVTGRNERLVRDFAELTSSKYGVGTGTQPDVLKAQVERSRLEDQLVALREERTGAVARLNALLGRPADTPLSSTELPEEIRVVIAPRQADGTRFASSALADVLPPSGDEGRAAIPETAELERLALEHNPMIQAHVHRVAAQERAVSLAEKATLPDIGLTAGYSHRAGFGDFFNVMISAPVPVFSGRKQDQAVLEEDATLAEHRAMHRSMVNDLNAEIASLTAELRRARGQLLLLDQGILPQARTALSSSTASYRVGSVDFLTLLDSQVTLYQHELSYHRLLADFASNLAALERAVGTEVLR